MEQANWNTFKKPFDLRERLVEFASVIIELIGSWELPLGIGSWELGVFGILPLRRLLP
jgi:hypothetical protein